MWLNEACSKKDVGKRQVVQQSRIAEAGVDLGCFWLHFVDLMPLKSTSTKVMLYMLRARLSLPTLRWGVFVYFGRSPERGNGLRGLLKLLSIPQEPPHRSALPLSAAFICLTKGLLIVMQTMPCFQLVD